MFRGEFRQHSGGVLYTFAMIRLFQSPRADAGIKFVTRGLAGLPKPREVKIGDSTGLEVAAVFIILAVVTTACLSGLRIKSPFEFLFPLAIVLSIVSIVVSEIFTELRNRPLLVKGECSAGKVISQRWVKSGRTKRSKIVYEFPVGVGKPMRGHGTDRTGEYAVNTPLLVFYDPDDIARNVALCCTRWRIHTGDGSLLEP